MEIYKGDKFRCTKDVVMSDDKVAYVEGRVYTSEYDQCITDEEGDARHSWLYGEASHYFEKLLNNSFRSITDRMNEIYTKKNHDYGDSFNESLDRYGLIASLVRMEDKLNRFRSLHNKEDILVENESLQDTLIDLANYSIMTVLWLNTRKDVQ